MHGAMPLLRLRSARHAGCTKCSRCSVIIACSAARSIFLNRPWFLRAPRLGDPCKYYIAAPPGDPLAPRSSRLLHPAPAPCRSLQRCPATHLDLALLEETQRIDRPPTSSPPWLARASTLNLDRHRLDQMSPPTQDPFYLVRQDIQDFVSSDHEPSPSCPPVAARGVPTWTRGQCRTAWASRGLQQSAQRRRPADRPGPSPQVNELQQKMSRFHGLTASNPERKKIAAEVDHGVDSLRWQVGLGRGPWPSRRQPAWPSHASAQCRAAAHATPRPREGRREVESGAQVCPRARSRSAQLLYPPPAMARLAAERAGGLVRQGAVRLCEVQADQRRDQQQAQVDLLHAAAGARLELCRQHAPPPAAAAAACQHQHAGRRPPSPDAAPQAAWRVLPADRGHG
jgi:hypothetical protein